MVEGASRRLLGRHVLHGAKNGSFPGDAALDVLGVGRPLGEAEVQDLHQTFARHHQVPRLQVPVHDPRPVRLREATRDLGGQIEQLLEREGTLLQPLLERPALYQFHRDEARTLVVTDFVDGGDVRVVESSRGTGLSFEALELIGVARRCLMEHLDRDLAAEASVAGPIDLSHPPCTDQVENLVRSEPGPAEDREPLRRRLDDRLLEEPLCLLLVAEQRLHLMKNVHVAATGILEEGVALAWRAPERGAVQLLDPLEVSRPHHESAALAPSRASRRISRRSHTFANCQSPFTVRGETLRTWAVSSTLRPPK